MGPTLNTAADMGAYTLTDRATWAAFKNKRSLVPLVEGDPRLFNQYGVTLVNPARFPHVKARDGQAFIDWLISPEASRPSRLPDRRPANVLSQRRRRVIRAASTHATAGLLPADPGARGQPARARLQENPALWSSASPPGQLPPLAERLPSQPLDRRRQQRPQSRGCPRARCNADRGRRRRPGESSPSAIPVDGLYESYALVRHPRALEIQGTTASSPCIYAPATAGRTASPSLPTNFRYYLEGTSSSSRALTPDGPAALRCCQRPAAEVEFSSHHHPLQLAVSHQAFVPALAGAEPAW